MWHSPWGTVRVSWMTGSLVVAGDNLWHGRPYWEFESDYAWPGINYGQPMEAEYSLLNALGFSYVAPPDFVPTNVPGFAYDPSVVGQVVRQRIVASPFYAIVFVTSLLPLLRAKRVVERTVRKRRGLCAVCGYDLCASPQRCPECGTAHP